MFVIFESGVMEEGRGVVPADRRRHYFEHDGAQGTPNKRL